MNARIRKLTALAMFAALSYALMFFIRIPIIPVPPYLKYDPKDVIIVIAGFLFGPLSSAAVSLVVSVIEMFTVSDTGPWGLLMNVLATCAFACTAAAIYRWKRSLTGAAVGLISGAVVATGVMLLWNYLIVPIYLGYPREAVAALLIPVFLPFNLLKTGLNAGFAMLLYKPVRLALSKTLLTQDSGKGGKMKVNIGVLIVSAFVIVTCVLLIMGWMGII